MIIMCQMHGYIRTFSKFLKNFANKDVVAISPESFSLYASSPHAKPIEIKIATVVAVAVILHSADIDVLSTALKK